MAFIYLHLEFAGDSSLDQPVFIRAVVRDSKNSPMDDLPDFERKVCMSFKAGDQLDVAGLTFEWSKEYDNISFEKISIGNVLEENEVEELAEFCISFQNRETPQKELEQKLNDPHWIKNWYGKVTVVSVVEYMAGAWILYILCIY